jgi:hypothetical protein
VPHPRGSEERRLDPGAEGVLGLSVAVRCTGAREVGGAIELVLDGSDRGERGQAAGGRGQDDELPAQLELFAEPRRGRR